MVIELIQDFGESFTASSRCIDSSVKVSRNGKNGNFRNGFCYHVECLNWDSSQKVLCFLVF